MIRSVLSAGEPTALIQREVLTLSDDEKRALLDKAGISSTIEIGAAEILEIKAGLAIPWNKLRLLKVRGVVWLLGVSCTARSKDIGCQGRCYGITQSLQASSMRASSTSSLL
ncbi:hypothetical protein EMCRGX_G023281 [Ephydatia muelleri]